MSDPKLPHEYVQSVYDDCDFCMFEVADRVLCGQGASAHEPVQEPREDTILFVNKDGSVAGAITNLKAEPSAPAEPETAQHVEQGQGERCSCGWTSHTKAWRAHAAHMKRRGETTCETIGAHPAEPDQWEKQAALPCIGCTADALRAAYAKGREDGQRHWRKP